MADEPVTTEAPDCATGKRRRLRRPRTPEQRTREREAERRRYRERKNDPEVIARRKATRKARYDRDPEKFRADSRKWIELHPEAKPKRKKYQADFRARHPGRKCASKRKRDRSGEKESEPRRLKRLARNRKRYAAKKDDPEFRAGNVARVKQWHAANPGAHWRSAKRRQQAFQEAKLLATLRARIRVALTRAHARKALKSEALLGCSLEHARIHLERRFRDGMSWENHGKVWHIDHIRPCCSFDLSKEEEQRACFNWTNLQPLLVAENIRKHGKY